MRAADPTRKQITLRDNEVFLIVRIHVPDNEMTDQKYFDAGFFGPAFGDLMGFELVYNVDTRSAILLPY